MLAFKFFIIIQLSDLLRLKYYIIRKMRPSMRRGSILDNISFNSYAAEQAEQGRLSYKVKIMILGAKSVGKSSIIETFTHQKKPIYQKQLVQQNIIKHTQVQQINNVQYHLHLWDTADFRQNYENRIPSSLYEGVLAFMIVYDITRRDTFQLVISIFSEIQHRGHKNKEIFLVGTNIQKANRGYRSVSYEQASKYAAARNMTVIQIQPSNAKQVQSLFRQILERIIQKQIFQVKGPRLVNSVLGADGFQKRYNRCC